jgi:hypothetical protein
MEKAGKPSVGIVAVGFEDDAMATARAFGLPRFRYALVPDVLTGLSPEQIEQAMVDALDQIIAVLTTDSPKISAAATAPEVKPAEHLKVEATDSYEAFEQMNRQFLDLEWGDGFPLIPPTPEKVARMLKATTLTPGDVVTVMTPGNGFATVEKIAINGVMAGCEPIHLPILIATCRAYTGLGQRARGMAMSTGPHAPLMVINGPIVKEVGINSQRCALGPGLQSRHNIVLGRALRLMMINIGNCRPGHMDMDTIGTARKFSLCVAENEEQSPWEPLHAGKGFPKDASTVTIFPTRDEIDVNDLYNWTPEGLLNSFAFYSAIPGGEYMEHRHAGAENYYHHLLMMCPEHANICGKAGWDKKAVRDYVHQQCRTSALRLLNMRRLAPDAIRPQWRWLLKLSDQELERTILPVMEAAHHIEIVVVGGPAGKDLVFRCISPPSTALIQDRAQDG